MTVLRSLVEADLPAALALCRAAGWNQLEADWREFLDCSRHGNWAACVEGVVAGTVCTFPVADQAVWISMLLVSPSHRGQGLGTRLLHQALDAVSDVRSVGLDATPQGLPIYRKHGFVVTDRLQRLYRPPQGGTEPSPRLIRPGHLAAHIGAIRARSTDEAQAQVAALCERHGGGGLLIDAFDPVDWLLPLGFSPQRTFYRMYRGTPVERDPAQVSIRGPEFS